MKSFSETQLEISMVGIILILLCSLFPPRQAADNSKARRVFFASPDIYTSWKSDGVEQSYVADSNGKIVSEITSRKRYSPIKAEIDGVRLLVEIVAIAALTFLGIFIQWRKK